MGNSAVLVVGAGITGVSAAEWLRREGQMVVLIDPVMPGDSDQASYGNAGLLARTSVVPVATPPLVRKAPFMVFDPNAPLFLRWSYLPRLVPWLLTFIRNVRADRMREISKGLAAIDFDTNEQHLALSQGTGAETYIASGEYVTLYPQRSDYEADALTIGIRRKYGLEPGHLTRKELLDRDPHLGPDYAFGTVFKDYGWLTSPASYVSALFDHYRRQGGQYRRARVVALTPGDRPGVTLDGGEPLDADKVVLAAGAWSAKLAGTINADVKLEAERGYHISMHAPSHTAPHPYMVTDSKFVMTPMDGFLRAAGVVEFAGLEAPASAQPVALIEKGVKRLYPGLQFEKAETWMGHRPTTPDSLPVIGEHPRAPNILHAYGGQHIGLTIGPKLGQIAADMVAGRRANIDLAPFRPDRF